MTDQGIYDYVPHHRTRETVSTAQADGSDRNRPGHHPSVANGLNTWLAVKVTRGVGTMWCAYAFVALACVSLPAAIQSRSAVVLVSWISQTFLQLVLLSVVIVGQNILAASADQRSEATHRDAEAVLHETVKLQEHLLAQDQALTELRHQVAALGGTPAH